MMRLHWTVDSIKQPIGFRITAFHVEIPTVGWYSWMIRSVCWSIQGGDIPDYSRCNQQRNEPENSSSR